MGTALHRLADEDPTFRVEGRSGDGRNDYFEAWVNCILEVLVDRMKREFGVEANVGRPQVAYQ